jgi:hypothetical protein
MPVVVRFEPRAEVVIGEGSGALSIEEAKEGASRIWGNPEWLGKPIIWDLRSAQLDLSSPEVREIAQYILGRQPSSAPPRVAFVAVRDVDFGLMRMFAAFREHPSTEVRVFRDYDEALAWASGEEVRLHRP